MGASVFKQATSTATTTGIQYVINDHLGGTNVVTDSGGNVLETLDYYPYGEIRLDTKASIYKGDKRKFTDHEYDTQTGWNYMNARYYEGSRGQFLSQDPAFLAIGSRDFEQKYERTLQQHLMNPQALNSYSYALNNPIRYTDPQGEIVPLVIVGAWAAIELGLSAYDVYSTAQTLNSNASLGEKLGTTGLTIAGFALPGGGYGKIGKEAFEQIARQTNTAGRVLMEGVNNADVLKIIKDNYKAGSTVGKNGSTADAVIHELLTGEKVGGKLHSIKAQEQINRINNTFKKFGSELSSQETKVLNQISNDLKSALKKKK